MHTPFPEPGDSKQKDFTMNGSTEGSSRSDSPSLIPLVPAHEKNKETRYVSIQKEFVSRIQGDARRQRQLGTRLELRTRLIARRRLLVDVEVIMSVVGIVLMMTENELFFANADEKASSVSLVLKTFISVSTIVLLVTICMYYHTGIEIRMLDGRVDDPFAVTPAWTWVCLCLELVVCAVHPLPGNFRVWIASEGGRGKVASIDGILSVLMLFRVYLLGRFAVVHSRLLTDKSTQTIGAVSKVKINMFFVFKAAMTEAPFLWISAIMACMFTLCCWGVRTCELYYSVSPEQKSFTSSLWLISMTFLTVGYGDQVPDTHCGRFMAVVTGMMGLVSTALLVAVIARRIEQTRSERYVYNFLSRVHLNHRRRHAAADVIKSTIRLCALRRRQPPPSATTFSLSTWRLRNAVRTMRSARASLAEIQETTVGLIEISQQISKLQHQVETTLRAHDLASLRMRSLETEVAAMRSDLRRLLIGSDRTELDQSGDSFPPRSPASTNLEIRQRFPTTV